MADNRISRRALVPGIAVGTAAVATTLAGQPAAAARVRRIALTAGPCSIWRGQALRFQFFLPAVQRGGDKASEFRLVLQDLQGSEIVTHDFELLPGKGTEVELAVTGDGSVRFNGEKVGELGLEVRSAGIIAILIGLLLPAVQKVRAAATSHTPSREIGEQNVNYLLPFVEQEN